MLCVQFFLKKQDLSDHSSNRNELLKPETLKTSSTFNALRNTKTPTVDRMPKEKMISVDFPWAIVMSQRKKLKVEYLMILASTIDNQRPI